MGNINRLIAIYAKVPKIHCQGLCHESCSLIMMQKLEYERLGSPVFTEMKCPILVDNRCSRYEVRPLVCRLFGVDVEMPCPFGCKIDGEPIDGNALMREVAAVSPSVRPTHKQVADILEKFTDDLDARAFANKCVRSAIDQMEGDYG